MTGSLPLYRLHPGSLICFTCSHIQINLGSGQRSPSFSVKLCPWALQPFLCCFLIVIVLFIHLST